MFRQLQNVNTPRRMSSESKDNFNVVANSSVKLKLLLLTQLWNLERRSESCYIRVQCVVHCACSRRQQHYHQNMHYSRRTSCPKHTFIPAPSPVFIWNLKGHDLQGLRALDSPSMALIWPIHCHI